MGAVGLLARHEIRRRLLRVVVLIVLVGAIGGIALAASAGARRSSTSLDRFRRSSHAADVELAIVGKPTAGQLRDLEHLGNAAAVAGLRAWGVVLSRERVLEAVSFGSRITDDKITQASPLTIVRSERSS